MHKWHYKKLTTQTEFNTYSNCFRSDPNLLPVSLDWLSCNSVHGFFDYHGNLVAGFTEEIEYPFHRALSEIKLDKREKFLKKHAAGSKRIVGISALWIMKSSGSDLSNFVWRTIWKKAVYSKKWDYVVFSGDTNGINRLYRKIGISPTVSIMGSMNEGEVSEIYVANVKRDAEKITAGMTQLMGMKRLLTVE